MEICSNYHAEIAHNEGANNCPMCHLISEYEKELEELQDKVEALQDKVVELQDKVVERELEIKCPHCGNLTYDEVDLTFQAGVNNEVDCTRCGETFTYKYDIEIEVKNLYTDKG